MENNFNSLKEKCGSHLSAKEKDYLNSNNANILKNLDGIPRDVFINLLKEHGDVMDDKEISECLQILRDDSNVKNLPEIISFQYLFNEILRFEEVRDKEEEENK
jgi:hypothetical protein